MRRLAAILAVAATVTVGGCKFPNSCPSLNCYTPTTTTQR